jgi:predicted transcriptional regulator
MGNLHYQLEKLEKMGKITSTRRGLYKYYFPAGLFKEGEKEILEVLTHETARKILMYIIERSNRYCRQRRNFSQICWVACWTLDRTSDNQRDQGCKIQKI